MMAIPRNPRASHAHEHPDLRNGNPLYERTGSARAAFEAQRVEEDAERAARRESFMVKRQQPTPVLRPSPSLALGSDSAAFNAQWEEECRQARAANLNQQARSNERRNPMENDPKMENTEQTHDSEQPDRNAPRDVLRDGNLKASIWSNEGEKGPFYSTTLARTWRDDDGQLHDSHSFAGTDLLRVSELARSAYNRTQELRREDHQQTQAQEPQRDAPAPQPAPEPAPAQSVAAPEPVQNVAQPQPEPQPSAPAPDPAREAFIQQRQEPPPTPQPTVQPTTGQH